MTSQANDCSYSCKKCCPRSSTTSCRPGAKILESTTSDDNPAFSSNNPALFSDKRGLLEPLFGA